MSSILRVSKRSLNKKPLLRPWFFNEKARNQPVNGEYDFNSGKGDYFFGKPYFVHQKGKDIFYLCYSFSYSSEAQVSQPLKTCPSDEFHILSNLLNKIKTYIPYCLLICLLDFLPNINLHYNVQ